ncbi:sigma-54-dependent transcriptional regulator [Novosphingopyxis iocasae]|uniref:sigma-54-dependent transcriptional regulator n=1 Tax=Novosphingopyxis iocasae TaxID=2762729 RepID=UPI001650E511|nr:sigma-54 dependent transcriptional regulator [Novosphingopyxis iocasae]
MSRVACSRVAFVDDDADLRRANIQSLELEGLVPQPFASGDDALARIDRDFEGVVVTDLRMPGMDGMQLLAALRERDPDLPVVLITGHGDVPLAVKAIRDGAYDFLTKPYHPETLLRSLRRALEQRSLVLDNRRLRAEAERAATSSALIGPSPQTELLRRTIDQLGPAEIDILIEGETGTGKSLVAGLLHRASGRGGKPMVTLDAAALPEASVESELFGHYAGAFPGAQHSRSGRVMSANYGTLFIDNLDALPLAIQPKLLRLIEDRVILPLGSDRVEPIDVRLIAASERDLGREVAEGRFLGALYYRLNAVTLQVPPLRERRSDIPVLFAHFLDEAAARQKRTVPDIGPGLWRRFDTDTWPGNVRELMHLAERHVLGLKDFEDTDAPVGILSLRERVASFEKQQIVHALCRTGGDIRQTMVLLELPRKTLYDKMNRFGISPSDWRG